MGRRRARCRGAGRRWWATACTSGRRGVPRRFSGPIGGSSPCATSLTTRLLGRVVEAVSACVPSLQKGQPGGALASLAHDASTRLPGFVPGAATTAASSGDWNLRDRLWSSPRPATRAARVPSTSGEARVGATAPSSRNRSSSHRVQFSPHASNRSSSTRGRRFVLRLRSVSPRVGTAAASCCRAPDPPNRARTSVVAHIRPRSSPFVDSVDMTVDLTSTMSIWMSSMSVYLSALIDALRPPWRELSHATPLVKSALACTCRARQETLSTSSGVPNGGLILLRSRRATGLRARRPDRDRGLSREFAAQAREAVTPQSPGVQAVDR